MTDPRAVRRDFSRAAAGYDDHARLQRDVLETLADLVAPYLTANSLVLDAGCGTGYFSRLAPRTRVIPLDSAFGMARIAASSAVCADICALPFADARFDLYVSSLSLQWIPPGSSAFAEAFRVLKPGGVAACSTLGPGTLEELRAAYLAAGLPARVNDFAAPEALETEIKAAGFSVLLFRHERNILRFPDALHLLRHLRGLGATYKAKGGGLRGRTYITALSAALRPDETAEIPATFQLLYYLLRKPGDTG